MYVLSTLVLEIWQPCFSSACSLPYHLVPFLDQFDVVFLEEHRFLLTACLFHDTNSDIYCIFKLPRGTRSQHCCHTWEWARTAEFQTRQSTCLSVVAIALGGPCHLPSNCFHRHYAFCPYTSSSWPFMYRSLSLTSSSTLATSLGSFVSNFLSNNSSDHHTCTLVRRIPRGN